MDSEDRVKRFRQDERPYPPGVSGRWIDPGGGVHYEMEEEEGLVPSFDFTPVVRGETPQLDEKIRDGEFVVRGIDGRYYRCPEPVVRALLGAPTGTPGAGERYVFEIDRPPEPEAGLYGFTDRVELRVDGELMDEDGSFLDAFRRLLVEHYVGAYVTRCDPTEQPDHELGDDDGTR